MLQAIRDRVTGLVAFFILGLLAVPFLFFGLESYIQRVPQDSVAAVNGEDITTSEFQTSFASYRATQRQRLGEAYDEISTNQPIVRREHLEGMVDQVLLRQFAEDLGMVVGQAQVLKIIQDIPEFQVDNQFDAERYRLVLRGAGRTPLGFEQELRRDFLINVLPSTLLASAAVTEAQIDQVMALRLEQRDLSLVEIDVDALAGQVEIDDGQVAAYYADHQDEYMTVEEVQIAYVELLAEDLTEGLSLSEEELRQRYEAAQQRFLTPEARRASHILITAGEQRDAAEAQALAAELRSRIDSGEDFAVLAADYSDDSVSRDQGGDLGWIEPGQMLETFEDALYSLGQPGALSEVVETRFGWHVIRLDEIRPPEGKSFEEARDEILAEYIERQSEELFIEQSERMVDLVFADDSTLEPLAEELGLEIQISEPFARSGGAGLLAKRPVIEAAFSDLVLLDGAVSDPIDIDRNHRVAVQLHEHYPAQPRPLEEVADSIRQRIAREQALQQARDLADSIVAEVNSSDVQLEEVVEQHDLQVEQLEGIGRSSLQHGPQFISQVFRLPTPAADQSGALQILDMGRNIAIVRLDQVTSGNPAAASEDQRESIRRQLQVAQIDREVTGLLEHLRAQADIQVVEDRL